MAVVVVAEVHGQTEAGYDSMLKALEGRIRQAEGFVLHSAYRAGSLVRGGSVAIKGRRGQVFREPRCAESATKSASRKISA